MKTPADEYLEKAKALSRKEAERLMARMRGRYNRRLGDKRISPVEALALQLEFEDEQLKEWRKNWAEVKRKDKN